MNLNLAMFQEPIPPNEGNRDKLLQCAGLRVTEQKGSPPVTVGKSSTLGMPFFGSVKRSVLLAAGQCMVTQPLRLLLIWLIICSAITLV